MAERKKRTSTHPTFEAILGPAKEEMEEMLCEHKPYNRIMKMLFNKYNIKVTASGLKLYADKVFYLTDKYKQRHQMTAQAGTDWVEEQAAQKARIAQLEVDAQKGNLKVLLAISQQIDRSLGDLYVLLEKEKQKEPRVAYNEAGLLREIREYLKFRSEYLRDPEIDKERRTAIAECDQIIAGIVTAMGIEPKAKGKLLDLWKEKASALLKP